MYLKCSFSNFPLLFSQLTMNSKILNKFTDKLKWTIKADEKNKEAKWISPLRRRERLLNTKQATKAAFINTNTTPVIET